MSKRNIIDIAISQYGGGPSDWHVHEKGGGAVANTATVDPGAYVGPRATVSGNATVGPYVRLVGVARVGGHAVVHGTGSGREEIACISGCVYGNADVQGGVRVEGQVFGRATLRGQAVIGVHACVAGNTVVAGSAKVLSGNHRAGAFEGKCTIHRPAMVLPIPGFYDVREVGDGRIAIGCTELTLREWRGREGQEVRRKAHVKSAENRVYQHALDLCEAYVKIAGPIDRPPKTEE